MPERYAWTGSDVGLPVGLWEHLPVPSPAADPRRGYVLVVSAAVFFVLNAGVSRVAMRAGVDPATLTTVRVTMGTLVFAGYALAVRRSALRPPSLRALPAFCLLGVVGIAGVQWTYNVAIDRVPVGIALLLEYLAPVLVVLWVRFVRGEAVRRRMWLAVGLCLVGLAVVGRVWQGLAFDGVGVLAGLGAAVCFATYFLAGERGVGQDDPLRVILWGFALAAVAMNLVSPVWTVDGLGTSASLLGSLDGLRAPLWALLVWVVLLGTVAPFFLSLAALQHLPSTIVTLVATLEPVGATVLGWAWFGEALTAAQVVGVLLVVGGICVAQSARTRAPDPVVPEMAV
ncbi:EamA family transporter [Solicola sp. PLA-1-18]|uniref:EamA family transporter n=1 Tax=Solicola sp. PLA-1-18 TaxID=3380532 RepID=UPI003B7F6FA3